MYLCFSCSINRTKLHDSVSAYIHVSIIKSMNATLDSTLYWQHSDSTRGSTSFHGEWRCSGGGGGSKGEIVLTVGRAASKNSLHYFCTNIGGGGGLSPLDPHKDFRCGHAKLKMRFVTSNCFPYTFIWIITKPGKLRRQGLCNDPLVNTVTDFLTQIIICHVRDKKGVLSYLVNTTKHTF